MIEEPAGAEECKRCCCIAGRQSEPGLELRRSRHCLASHHDKSAGVSSIPAI